MGVHWGVLEASWRRKLLRLALGSRHGLWSQVSFLGKEKIRCRLDTVLWSQQWGRVSGRGTWSDPAAPRGIGHWAEMHMVWGTCPRGAPQAGERQGQEREAVTE